MDLNSNAKSLNSLGIIAGSGLLPAEIANLYSKKGGKVYIAALDGETDMLAISSYKHKKFEIGLLKPLLEYFRENSVTKIIIIGGIKRPDLKSIRIDKIGASLITKIVKEKFLGDNTVLKVICNFIESKGFTIISPRKVLDFSNYEELYVTHILPSKQDKIDIELGRKAVKHFSTLDIGQSVIVSNGYILGVEAAEGTDALIRRCHLLRKNNKGGVLIKMAKINQDMRLDVPTVGPDTIFCLVKYNYNGLAIQKSKVIIVNPLKTINLLNKNNLFMHYL